MKRLGLACVGVLVIATLFSPTCLAIAPFYKEFKGKYVEGNNNEEFVAKVKATKCNICHVGKKKKTRNDYGKELDNLLDKKTDKKDVEKIRKALETVAQKPIDPDGDKSMTYAKLFSEGELPKNEPKADGDEGGETIATRTTKTMAMSDDKDNVKSL